MHIEIITRNVELTTEDHERAEERCSRMLSRYGDHIRHVTIRLLDINGPRGGVDKRCTLMIRLRDGGQVTVNRTAETGGAAIGRSLEVARSKIRNRYGTRKGGILMAA